MGSVSCIRAPYTAAPYPPKSVIGFKIEIEIYKLEINKLIVIPNPSYKTFNIFVKK